MLTKKQLRDAAGCVGHCEDCSVPAEAQQQELEKLKELTENLKELTTRHIFHKMTPSTCSIPIQVFENREEWLEFARVNFAITKLLGESEVGEDDK